MADPTLDLGPPPHSNSQFSARSAYRPIDEAYQDVHYEPIPPFGLFCKRAVDLVLAIPAMLVFAPVFAIVALAIRLDSRGPVFYRSNRVGKGGVCFDCYKFRSMIVNADEFKESLRRHNQRTGPTFKIKDDPRLTRLGPFLRRYSLDELPQIWNVIRGEMSIVGPRPHPYDDVVRYRPEHLQRCVVKPGLTCLWQIKARRDPSFDVNMALDVEYVRNWSLGLDFKIIAQTFTAVFRGEGQ